MDENINSEQVNEFNRGLRESVDLAKQLAREVERIPSELNMSISKNRQLIDTAKEYRTSLEDTAKLSSKIASGKIKEKELQTQLNTLQQRYNDFLATNESSFERGGRFIKKRRDIQRELNTLEAQQLQRRDKIMQADLRIDQLQTALDAKRQLAASTTSSTQRRLANDAIKQIQDQIKAEQDTIYITNAIYKNSARVVAQKGKQLQQVNKIIGAYNQIKTQYQNQIAANQAVINQLRQQTIQGRLFSNNLFKTQSALKSIGSLLAPFGAIFGFLKNIAFSVSDQVTRIQKNLILSRESAYDLRQGFNDAAVSSGELLLTTNKLIEANIELGNQLGFNSRFSNELNMQFVKLTKQIGLSNEAAGGLAKLSKVNNISLEQAKNISLETSQALSSQYGLQLDQKQVLEEIGKISGQMLAMFKASPQALAQAVAQAKLLGTNLDIARKQAGYLLDFETSIENELQAELLTGRRLNLERARAAALTGNLTTMMQELNNQNIDFNKFSNLNVIAQEKLANSLGLTSDELADQLLKQQYMNMSREQVAALAGEEVAQRLEALSAQDKFNAAVDKMQDIVTKLVGGPFGKLADQLASMAENSTVLYGAMFAIAGLSLAKLITGLAAAAVQAVILAAGSITLTSALTVGLGAVAVAGMIGYLMSKYLDAKEQSTQAFAEGGIVYGPTKALIGEYSGAENNPEVVAPLSDLQNIIDKNRVVVKDNTPSKENVELLTKVNGTLEKINDGINKLYNKQGLIKIDSQRLGTTQLIGNYNLA